MSCYGYRSNSTDPNTELNYVFPLSDAVPCPTGGGCCRSGDACLSNSICQYIGWTPPGVSSGYYMGSCTDPTFESSSCPKQCTALTQPGVVYDSTLQQWRCCGASTDGDFQCDDPTDIIVLAPAPDQMQNLSALAFGGASTTRNPSSTSLLPSGSDSVSNGISTTGSGGLSTGAKAGIGAGGGVAVIVIVALIAWIVVLRRKKRPTPPELAQHTELLPRDQEIIVFKDDRTRTTNRIRARPLPRESTTSQTPKYEYHRQDTHQEMLPEYSDGAAAHPNAAEMEAASRVRAAGAYRGLTMSELAEFRR